MMTPANTAAGAVAVTVPCALTHLSLVQVPEGLAHNVFAVVALLACLAANDANHLAPQKVTKQEGVLHVRVVRGGGPDGGRLPLCLS